MPLVIALRIRHFANLVVRASARAHRRVSGRDLAGDLGTRVGAWVRGWVRHCVRARSSGLARLCWRKRATTRRLPRLAIDDSRMERSSTHLRAHVCVCVCVEEVQALAPSRVRRCAARFRARAREREQSTNRVRDCEFSNSADPNRPRAVSSMSPTGRTVASSPADNRQVITWSLVRFSLACGFHASLRAKCESVVVGGCSRVGVARGGYFALRLRWPFAIAMCVAMFNARFASSPTQRGERERDSRCARHR